jgi:hypothetical protein
MRRYEDMKLRGYEERSYEDKKMGSYEKAAQGK